MSRAKEIGNHALWVLGHVLFTIVAVCSARGGYEYWNDYVASQGVQIDLSQLEDVEKEQLASALIEDGFSVPKNTKKSAQ